MTSINDTPRRPLTFSQRYGYEPLPGPMRLEELSHDLRVALWDVVYDTLRQITAHENTVNWYLFQEAMERIWAAFKRLPKIQVRRNRLMDNRDKVYDAFESVVLRGKFNVLLDLLEIMLRERAFFSLSDDIKRLFREHEAAYWLDTTKRPHKFMPCASREQAEATRKAIETLHEAGMNGAATHLRQAGEHINARQHADAIVDCIHAVESVARVIAPKATTLGPALHSLEKAGLLKHRLLKEAFEKLYGYTNAEEGIRHALVSKDSADVGLDEALFMFGACASAAAYLAQKHRRISDA